MPVPVLIEPIPILDEFVSGLAPLGRVGPCVRLPFYSEQTLYEARCRPVCIVARKLIIPHDAVLPCVRQMLVYLGDKALDDSELLRMVH